MSHLDDEALNAHFDGAPDESGHVAGCAECRARLEVLESVRAAVAAPVLLPSPERIDAAVAAAKAARVVPLQARRRGLTVLAAAAAVVVVLGSLAALRSDDDKAATVAPTSDQVASGGATLFEGGDLGDQSDPAALALRVKAAVEPTESDSDDAGGDASTESQTAGAPLAATSGAKRSADNSPDPDCTRAVAREYATGLGPLSYKASLRWQGTPAVVLVYPVSGAEGPLDHRVLVMATGDCRLLVVQTI